MNCARCTRLPHVLLFGLIAACSTEASPEAEVPGAEVVSVGEVRLEFVREIGSLDGEVTFGAIAALASDDQGRLAVSDASDCTISIFEADVALPRRIGGCGDGPGEFRNATVLTFDQSQLLVYDADRGSLQTLTLEGEEIRRQQIPLDHLGALWVGSMRALYGDTLVVGLELFPAGLGFHDHAVLLRKSDLEPLLLGVPAPEIARTTTDNSPRSGPLCVSSSGENGNVLAAINAWEPGIRLLRASDLTPLDDVDVAIDWAGPRQVSGQSDAWRQHAPVPRIVCGSEHALAGYRMHGRNESGETEAQEAALVAVNLATRELVPLEAPSELTTRMTPGAASGDRFYLFTNGFHSFPVVHEYRLVSR